VAVRYGSVGRVVVRRTASVPCSRPLVAVLVAAVVLVACGAAGDGAAAPAGQAGRAVPTGGGGPGGGPLFTDSVDRGAAPVGPQVVRHRYVTIDSSRLLTGAEPVRADRYVFNLFPDAVFEGSVDEVHRAGDSVSWSGRFDGDRPGSFTMVYTAGVYRVQVAVPPAVFEVVTAGPGLYRVDEIDQSRFPQRD